MTYQTKKPVLFLLLAAVMLLQGCCELTGDCEEEEPQPQQVTVRGNVRSSLNGQPVIGALITFGSASAITDGASISGLPTGIVTDQNGDFSFEAMVLGRISLGVFVSLTDFETLQVTDFEIEDNGNHSDTRFSLDPVFPLTFDRVRLDMGLVAVQGTFILTNQSSNLINYQIASGNPVVSVSPESGTIESSGSVVINVALERDNLPLGSQDVELTVTAQSLGSTTLVVAFETISPDQLNWVDEDGDGLIDIRTINDLHRLSLEYDRDTFNTVTGFELVRDLDFQNSAHYRDASLKSQMTEGEGWLPIGTRNTPFNVIFEGNNFGIRNLYLDRNTEYTGLFGYTGDESTIRNLTLELQSFRSVDFAGGLAGSNRGQIESCHVLGRIIADGRSVGLLVGHHQNGRVYRCTSAGSIVSSEHNIGGLIGLMGGFNNDIWEVESSYSSANVTGTYYIGGLVGYRGAGWGRLYKCYANGSVVATGQGAGGLVGRFSGDITSCYATGSVSSSNSEVGGLVGYYSSGTMTTSFSTGEVSGDRNVGGLVGLNRGSINDRNYFDTNTSGASYSSGGIGQPTIQLKGQTSAIGIYITWNPDIWDFGSTSQYPALINMPGGYAAQGR